MEHHQYIFVNISSPQWLLYSALLLLAIFFRFSRLWSIRNLDLILLLTLSAVLVVSTSMNPMASPDGEVVENAATAVLSAEVDPVYRWATIGVLILSMILVGRLVFDESFTRRPRLDQNLNQAGLTFLLVPAFFILMTAIFLKNPPLRNYAAFEAGNALLKQTESRVEEENVRELPTPTETILAATATKVAELSGRMPDASKTENFKTIPRPQTVLAQLIILMSHSAVVMGLLYIGRKHFNSMQLGVSMCCLYLILPCTAFNVHQVSHVVPAACMTWAFASYRKPVVAGILLGLACGTLFFAVFLIPLWAVFYGRNGGIRFGISLAVVTLLICASLAFTSHTTESFISKVVVTANWTAFRLFDAATPLPQHAIGQMFFRFILAILFLVMLVAVTMLPRKRNLESLLAHSAAVIVAAQLWYPDDVGSYVLWYLPLFLLVMFRPRLDRFQPPAAADETSATRRTDGKPAGVGGGLSRVTLYS